jgi:predicted transcriptional regulator
MEIRRHMGARTRRAGTNDILGLLDGPKTTSELREKLGLSRQAIHQKLKRLTRQGVVRRVTISGEVARHAYLPAAGASAATLATRFADLRLTDARLLSALRSDAECAAPDVARIVARGSSVEHKQVARLAKIGLITFTHVGRVRVLRITKRGIEHPQYKTNAPKAPPHDPTRRSSRRTIRIMILLHALGQARTVDLTLLTRFRKPAAGHAGTAHVIHRLKKTGYVEEVPHTYQSQPPYRLTSGGRKRVASLIRHVPVPDPADLRRRLCQELARFSQARSRRARPRAIKRFTNTPLSG